MKKSEKNAQLKETNRFYSWAKRAGIDLSNTDQVCKAFASIEPKNVSLQNPVHKFFV